MTTNEQSGSQSRPRATANPNWGLGFSLVLAAAIVAAYLITAPRALTPGVAVDPAAANIDPQVKSVADYLAVHSRMDAASPSLAPNAGANPRVQSMLEYLRAHPPAAAPKAEFSWMFSWPFTHMPTQPANWLTGSPTIVMPTQPVNWLTGAPSTDLPTEAWDASHYPNGLDK